MARTQDPGHIPGPVFIPGCAAVRLMWQLPNGKIANNILHGSYTTPPPNTQSFINTLFTAISSGWNTSGYQGQCVSTFKLANVGVRDLAEVPPPGSGVGHGEIVSNNAAVAGSGTGDALPAGISNVVSLKTGLSRQANRGRVYLTGYTEAWNLAAGVMDPAVQTAGTAFITAVQSAMNSNGLVLCLAHPARAAYTGHAGANHPQRTAGTVQVTQIVSLNNVWDSTRLRSLH